MGFNNIEEKSLGYSLLYTTVRFWHNVVFYKKVIVVNKQNIPKDANVIFTPNHQNALMDALALLFTIPRRLVFMARADIFAKPALAAILYFIKILPIYRSRDGKGSVQKNKAVFVRTVDVLTAGCGLVLLPEGSHEGVHKIRPLKKGFARIAFQTEESNNFSLDIKIVPIGIDYSNYQDFRTTLIVNFGAAISVSDYYDQFKENPALAINGLKDDLEGKMKELIVNIESEEYYELYDLLKDIYNDKMRESMGLTERNHPNKFKADRELIRLLGRFEKENPEEMPALDKLVKSYSAKRNRYGFSNELLQEGRVSVFSLMLKSAWLVATLPVFIFGFLNNMLPWGITVWAGSKIKDPQFKSSFKFVVLMLAFPIFYILQTVVFALFCKLSWGPWIYLLSLPISAVLAWWWNSGFKHLKNQWKFLSFAKKSNPGFVKMMEEYHLIIGKADEVVS